MKPQKPHPFLSWESSSSPVECICGVWQYEREPRERELITRSTPGHLLHYILKGGKDIIVNGRKYSVKTGDVIYYYEFEEVRSIIREEMAFISVSFLASGLPPLPLNRRCIHAQSDKLAALFTGLFEAYNRPDSYQNKVKCHKLLLEILDWLIPAASVPETKTRRQKLWPEIECWLRRERRYRPAIDEICEHFKVSPATVARACRTATGGMTPTEYFRAFRLEEAQALLRYSGMNVTEIAEYLGYPRLHEFSREFSRYFQCPPSDFLKNSDHAS